MRALSFSRFTVLNRPVLNIAIFRFVSLVLLCALASLGQAADLRYAKAEKVGLSSDKLQQINTQLEAYVDSGQLQGVVTLVARKGAVVHTHTYGKLDIETGAPLQEDSLFRIYSMTKPIVNLAAMQLYQQGKFQLTDPVEKYLPAFKDVKVLVDGKLVAQHKPFTIQQLMTHTSGLVYDFMGSSPVVDLYRKADLRSAKNTSEFVKKISALPLQEQPGTRWVYSFSTDVLGHLVEVISGEPLDQYLRNYIFEPLNMRDTFFQIPADKLSRFGTNHQFDAQGNLNIIDRPSDSAYAKPVTFFSGGGGLVSTAADYMHFCQMLLNGGELNGQRVIGSKTIEYMTRNHLQGIFTDTDGSGSLINRPGFGFGLGFAVTVDPAASGTISSPGEYYWSGAAGTIFWIDPKEELIVISLIQQRSSRVPLRNTLKAIAYGAIVD